MVMTRSKRTIRAVVDVDLLPTLPVVIMPQILICGLLVPLSALPNALESIAYWMPVTYAVDALNLATQHSRVSSDMWHDVWMIGAFIAGSLVIASLTLRRRSN